MKTKLLILILAAMSVAFSALGQEYKRFHPARRDSLRLEGSSLPDSLVRLLTWSPTLNLLEPMPMPVHKSKSPTIEVSLKRQKLPSQIVILDNNTLYLGGYVTVSTGQASNWGPYLNSFLDARTLSFPAPR